VKCCSIFEFKNKMGNYNQFGQGTSLDLSRLNGADLPDSDQIVTITSK